MIHTCNVLTDLNELIGIRRSEGRQSLFYYGPLALAMKAGDELILENSGALSEFMLKKINLVLVGLFISDTNEVIHPGSGFRLTLR